MPVFLWLGFLGCQGKGRSGQSASPPTWKDHWGLHLECISFSLCFLSQEMLLHCLMSCNAGPYLNEDRNFLYLHMWQNQSEIAKQWFPWKIKEHCQKHSSPVSEGLVFSWSSCQWQCSVGLPSPSFQSVKKHNIIELEKSPPGNINLKKK